MHHVMGSYSLVEKDEDYSCHGGIQEEREDMGRLSGVGFIPQKPWELYMAEGKELRIM